MSYLQNMTPSDLEDAVKKDLPLFISAGSIEYHGSQLPLGTDLFITEGVLREIEKRTEIVVAPAFTFCPTGFMVSGPENGTVDIRIGTFIEYCSEILSSYKKMGFKHIYILVHHQGGNIRKFLETAIFQLDSYSLYEDYGNGWWTKRVPTEKQCEIKVLPAVFGEEVTKEFFGHGGEGETQPIMALYPELVHMEKFTDHEAFWNESAVNANKKDADRALAQLIDLWVEKIKNNKL
ncbi:MAG: creatininase family protein [Clostridia bacterium]|nr:creatininase family protein [Clostridia bacterium]